MQRLLVTLTTALCGILTATTAHASFVERLFVENPDWNQSTDASPSPTNVDAPDAGQAADDRDASTTHTALDMFDDLPGTARMTRAQFTALLVRSMHSEASISRCYWDITSVRPPQFELLFRDVSVDHAYAAEICVAMRDGLVRGYGNDIFRPEDTIRFADAAKILARAHGLTPWADASQPEHWFDIYVSALSRRNAIPMTIDNLEQIITIGDAREMIRRLSHDDRRQSSRTADELIADWERSHEPPRPVAPSPKAASAPATPSSRASSSRASVRPQSSAGTVVSSAPAASSDASAATSHQSSRPKAWYEF